MWLNHVLYLVYDMYMLISYQLLLQEYPYQPKQYLHFSSEPKFEFLGI